MKKLIFVISVALVFTSCTRDFEKIINNYSYVNPRKEGGLYTVVQNGVEIKNLKCVYWSTEDDDAVFENKDGKKVFVNGSSIIIEQ